MQKAVTRLTAGWHNLMSCHVSQCKFDLLGNSVESFQKRLWKEIFMPTSIFQRDLQLRFGCVLPHALHCSYIPAKVLSEGRTDRYLISQQTCCTRTCTNDEAILKMEWGDSIEANNPAPNTTTSSCNMVNLGGNQYPLAFPQVFPRVFPESPWRKVGGGFVLYL